MRRSAKTAVALGIMMLCLLGVSSVAMADVSMSLYTSYSGYMYNSSASWYSFTAPYSAEYVFQSSGAMDTKGELYLNKSHAYVAYNDDSGEGRNFYFTYRLNAGQTAYLKVYGWGTRQTGTFRVSADMEPSTVYTGSTTQSLNRGTARWYRFTAPSAGAYLFSTSGSLDTVGELYQNRTGNWVAYNDDQAAGNRNFKLSYNLSAGQTVYLRVRSHSGSAGGNFTLSISKADIQLSSYSKSIGVDGGSLGTVSVTTPLSWTARSSASWLSVSPTSGNGNGTLTLRAGLNTTGASRSASITVSGGGLTKTIRVSQATYSDTALTLNRSTGTSMKQGAARWFVFTAPSRGQYMFYSGGSLDTVGALYSAKTGSPLVSNDNQSASKRNFKLGYVLNAGQRVYLKVYGANSAQNGNYTVKVAPGVKVTKVRLSSSRKTLTMGKSTTLKASVSPSKADKSCLTWTSSNTRVATVSSTGKVTAVGPGTATIKAKAPSGKYAKCKITVKRPAVSKVYLNKTSAALKVGERLQLSTTVSPSGASAGKLKWTSSNKKVAGVTSSGAVVAKKAGSATITVKTSNGKKASCRITVTNPNAVTRRGLVVVEASGTNGTYSSSTQRQLEKSVGTVNLNGVASMLRAQSFGGSKISVSTMRDPGSWASVAAKIRSTFAGSKEQDVNYLYINCHGARPSGSNYYLAIGKNRGFVSAAQLRSELDKIPGKFVVIVEACYSGALVGKGGADQAAQGFLDEFLGATGKAGALESSKYMVLCAANSSQESWSCSAPSLYGERNFKSAVFTYSFCRGAGWNNVRKKSTSMAADSNGDKKVTLNELYRKTYSMSNSIVREFRRKGGGMATQSAVVYPANCNTVIFQKK